MAGSAADRRDLSAARAAGPALFAGPAPRRAGGLGDHARAVAAADVAGEDLPGQAGRAERPRGGAGADRAPAAAAAAGLVVDRIGDQAGGTQRPAVLVAGGRFAHRAATRARLGPGPGHAVAA